MLLALAVVAGCGKEEAQPSASASSSTANRTFAPGVVDVEYGHEMFTYSCSECHGSSGQGMPNQAPDLRGNPFLAQHTDAQVIEFLRVGRKADDPANKTKRPMPARGNPPAEDADLVHIMAYMRTLQPQVHDSASGNVPAVGANATTLPTASGGGSTAGARR